MHTVYVLVPLFKIDSKAQIESKSRQLLGLDTKNSLHNITVHQLNPNESVLHISNFHLNFLQLNSILQSYQQAQNQISLYESVIKDYQFSTSFKEESIGENVDHMMRKIQKYKEIKEENKKLKKLLQVQLENTQKVRQQTQKTMKILREQFDALVLEMSKKQKHFSNPSHGQQASSSEIIEPQPRQIVAPLSLNATKHTSIR